MCFVKSSKPSAAMQAQLSTPEPEVIRKQADATLTKSSTPNLSANNAYKQNIRTSALGLTDNTYTSKNTLLGE